MLPVCSTTTNCSCQAQIPIHGGLKSSFDVNSNNVDKVVRNFSNGILLGRASQMESVKRRPASCFYSNYVVNSTQCGSMDMINRSSHGLSNMKQLTLCSYQVGVIDEPRRLGPSSMIFVEGSTSSSEGDQLVDLTSKIVDNTVDIPSYADPEMTTPFYGVTTDPSPVPDLLNVEINPLSDPKTSVAEMSESFADTVKSGGNVLNSAVDTITSSVTTALTDANKAVNSTINDIISFINKSGESANGKLTGFSNGLKEASGRAGLGALDVLRQTVVIVEDSLIQGAKIVGYGYNSTKESLPPEFQDVVNLSEDTVIKILGPVGTAIQQVYIALEGFEKSLGLDPNDPLVQFVLFLGLSATLWGSYRVLVYGGYAGDLSPQSTLELLQGNENVVLIDIRPENLKERDGIPDLRRTARFRYASLTVPEVDDSLKKLLKGGRDIEDSLLAAIIRNLKIVEGQMVIKYEDAAIIRNLKIVEDRSKVLVMDADGTRSKGVARSLRKLGTKRPYLVQGGFQSWVKEGFRVKELKPETALTILNEEAEAILEEINPTPLKLIVYGMGLVAAAYSLVEWEMTLQLIGVIGLGQTILRRVVSYQDAEDIKKDVRFLLTPARLGGQAISWAAGKLETNRNGLPTSPSSSDVQSRVLQAAAKHESQPSENEETSQMAVAGNQDVNISEA